MLIKDGVLVNVSQADIIDGTIDFSKAGVVTSIGECAFSGCSSLTTVTIPDGVTTIGKYAFSDCSSLTTLTIPDSVSSIDWVAFSGCNNLKDIVIVVKPSGSTAEEIAKNHLVQFERVAMLIPKHLQGKINNEHFVSSLANLAASHYCNNSSQQASPPSVGVAGGLGLFKPEQKNGGESSTSEDDNAMKP